MRMKFNKSSQLMLVSAVSLLAASLMTACGTLTVDFVYVTSAKAAGPNSYGEVNVFEVNSESGFMRQIKTSPFPSGGRNPVAEAVSSDNTNLYVVNKDDNTIVQFIIGNDGKLYPQNTVNTPGVFPLSVAVTSSHLFVADTFQPLPTCSTAAPCSGSVAVFPIKTDKSLDKPVANSAISASYWPLTLPANPAHVMAPTAITPSGAGAFVYVAAYDATTSGGYIFGFTVNSDGTLTALNGGVPFPAGIHPSAIVSDPTGTYLYVTDANSENVLGYQINAGLLTPLSSSPFKAGSQPSAMAIDASGKFAFVTNAQDSNLTAYSIGNGALTSLGTYTTGSQPMAVGIDPSKNEFVYTANFLGNTVSGFAVNASNGSLLNSQGSPYVSNALPTAVAAIPHGSLKKK
jgi:6-phosphogluconolactonase (cycloisomerase 2 family)